METCGDKEHVVKPFYLIKLAYFWIFIFKIEPMTKFIDHKTIWRILPFGNKVLFCLKNPEWNVFFFDYASIAKNKTKKISNKI